MTRDHGDSWREVYAAMDVDPDGHEDANPRHTHVRVTRGGGESQTFFKYPPRVTPAGSQLTGPSLGGEGPILAALTPPTSDPYKERENAGVVER
jgi:hypothetical protein